MNIFLIFACHMNTWMLPVYIFVYALVAIVIYTLGKKWRPNWDNFFRLMTIVVSVGIIFNMVRISQEKLMLAEGENPHVCKRIFPLK